MREVNFIEDKGRFGITFMSDDKAEANTVMNAIQRFILKNSNKETKENIDDNCKSYAQDYSRNPLDGPSKGVYLNLYTNDRLIELYNNDKISQGHKDYIKDLLNERGITDLSMPNTKKKNNTKNQEKSNTIIENIKEHELNNKIENIKNGRDMMQLSNEELEEIALLESELASICGYSETAKHILQGRKFNRSRELENKITQGRRLSELTLEELGKLKEITMIESYKEDIQKEINKRENKSFEETLKENNEIISFSEDEEHSDYKIDEDPLSADTDNINNWDFDADGDKVDIEGNKFLFED